MQRTMAKQAEAEREKRKVIAAEGEQLSAAAKLGEAAVDMPIINCFAASESTNEVLSDIAVERTVP